MSTPPEPSSWAEEQEAAAKWCDETGMEDYRREMDFSQAESDVSRLSRE